MKKSGRAVLIILDGFGIGKESPFNAISNSKMPFYQKIWSQYPHSQLITHGEAVGLPYGVMGNSEVGHMTMGAGRTIYQDLTRITKAICDRSFFQNPILLEAFRSSAQRKGRVHLIGLFSSGGVHSHLDHLDALIELGQVLQVPSIFLHLFLDGRDTPPHSSLEYLEQLEPKLEALSESGKIEVSVASIHGRYYAMDRDKRWDRVEKCFRVLVGQTTPVPFSPKQVIEKNHAAGVSDEFVEPVLLNSAGAIGADDSVIFFNFRSDRAREISRAFTDPDFSEFNRGADFRAPLSWTGLTLYDKSMTRVNVAFLPQNLDHIFGEWLEGHDRTQFRTAETEKYAHVTFFFNGGREAPFRGEDRLLIPSPKEVATYDLKPEMSAFLVAKAAAERLVQQKYDFMLMNFANADMVGHTGNYEATVKAMEALDQCLAQVIGAAEKAGYHALLTSDHGNAEEMRDSLGRIHTQHTLNPVPAIWIAPDTAIAPRSSRQALKDGTLSDIMPTLCKLMNLDTPKEVTGKSLLPIVK